MKTTGLFAAFALALGTVGCVAYDPPPSASVVGLVEGELADNDAPLEILFSEPFVPGTLDLKVVVNATDKGGEGFLGDEDDDPATELNLLFSHSGTTDTGGTLEIVPADAAAGIAENTLVRITHDEPFPIGPKLLVLVEPGLTDEQGFKTTVRSYVPFSYTFSCDQTAPTKLVTGPYFFLFEIEKPIPVQLQIWGDIVVNSETGKFVGQFTNADRNPDPNRCSPACDEGSSCATVSGAGCVLPSTKAATVDEYPDYVVNPTGKTGYSFAVSGCAVDGADGSIAINTLPATLSVQSPPVDAVDLTITCVFVEEAGGVLRCAGNAAAEEVLIGGEPNGPAEGSSAGRTVPPGEEPADMPRVPEGTEP